MSGGAQGSAGLAAAFAEMPLVLKGVTSFFALFGAGSLVLPLAPGIDHRVAGETLGLGGLWRSGLGPSALVLGLWLLACAWGLLQRSAWSCWGVVLAAALLAAAERAVAAAGAPGAQASSSPALQAALAAAWAIAAWAYLFRTRGARRFFTPPPRGPA